MRLYFIRHGQSVNNLIWAETQSDKGRSHDPELTTVGYAQAECVAQFLRDELSVRLPHGGMNDEGARPKILYTSLMTRAVETGRTIAGALDVPLTALSNAHEVGGLFLADEVTGERRGMEGPNRAHFEKHAPELGLPRELGEIGWWNRPFEEKELRPARAAQVWQEILSWHGETDDIIGLVTHGGLYNHLLKHILKVENQEGVWFTLNNCAVSRLDVTAEAIVAVYLNRFDFLPPDLIT